MISDDELRARNPRDLALYQLALRTLRARVREVEARMNATIWDCAGGGAR